MTNHNFLSDFEHHLLVGEPKRGEILAELKTHLDDLNGADPLTLGSPKCLAQAESRIYLRFLCSPLLLFAMPVLMLIILTALKVFASVETSAQLFDGPGTEPLNNILFFVSWMLPCTVTALVGWTIARMHHPAQWALCLLILTLITGTVLGVLYNYTNLDDWEAPQTLGGMFGLSFITAFFQTLWFGAIGSGIIILAAPRQNGTPRFIRAQTELQLLVAVFGILGSLVFIIWWYQMDIDGANFVLPYLPALLGLGVLAPYFVKRYRKWRMLIQLSRQRTGR